MCTQTHTPLPPDWKRSRGHHVDTAPLFPYIFSDVGMHDRVVIQELLNKRPLFLYVFSDVGMHDRVVIQELLKKVAQANQIDTSSQKDFKGAQSDKWIFGHKGQVLVRPPARD